MSQENQPSARRRRAYVSIWGTTQLHLRNPVIVALWSAIFPGMGHLLLSKYIRGIILFMWEITVNLMSHMNLSIFYTFTLRFDMAKQVLDIRWLMLYIPVYLFAIWDSYRTSVDINNHFILAVHEDAEVKPFVLHALGVNYLDKSSPWVAVFWSMISPGMGQLIIHRIIVAFFLVAFWIVIIYMSKALPSIHYTLMGNFEKAKSAVDIQWVLNIPSLFFFGIYDAYVNTVESNKLFDWELSKFLKRQYQSASFQMPANKKRGNKMYIVSTFKYEIKLETAITNIEMKGVPKESIMAVPLDKKNEDRMLFDRTHYSDSISMFDVPMITAAIFGLLGLIYGFLLAWGPVLWALIGTGLGFFIGLGIKLITTKKKDKKQNGSEPEVVLIVNCAENQIDMVHDILWANGALGVAKLNPGEGA